VEAVLFFIFAASALVGALGVVLARNPVHSALFLIMTLVSVAVFFVLRDAPLLAAVQIIVYAGAIVVLFLFVIMLLGVDRNESISEPLPFQRPIAILLGLFVFAEIVILAGRTWSTGARSARGELGNTQDNVRTVAENLFTDFLWPFEMTAGLLVIAVVGSVLLARRSGQRPGVSDSARAELEQEETTS
jgi:NADH-quinone oxidoreductase subunit J